MKRIVRLLLLATTPALFVSVQQTSALQSAPQDSGSPAHPQVSNQASSHDRHHRRHSTVKRRHHRKSSTQH